MNSSMKIQIVGMVNPSKKQARQVDPTYSVVIIHKNAEAPMRQQI